MIKHRIKDILKERGLTQNDLAVKMGTTQETVSRQINGNPTLKTLNEIANTLNVELWELFTTETDNSKIYGFIEHNGQVHKIQSISDIQKLLNIVKQ